LGYKGAASILLSGAAALALVLSPVRGEAGCVSHDPATRVRRPLPPEAAETVFDEDIPLPETLLSLSSPLGIAPADPDAKAGRVGRELDRLALRIKGELSGNRSPRRVVSAMNRVIFGAEGFVYDPAPGDPGNYLLDKVLDRRRGNCLGLSLLYLSLAERLSLPLRGVYVPSHCFVRYERGGVRINIETAASGAEREDGWYVRRFRISGDRPYLKSLGRKEMLAVFLKSLGAALARRGKEDEALQAYRRAARLYPGLPDAWYNAGILYGKKGLADEAIVSFHRAVALDPELASARNNLGAALASSGRLEEALAEFRRAVALEPGNVKAWENLAGAACACGRAGEGAEAWRKVLSTDPQNARARAALARMRRPAGPPGDVPAALGLAGS
jgi:regulator of sirC expression with transglutaminase-like and TPR domain